MSLSCKATSLGRLWVVLAAAVLAVALLTGCGANPQSQESQAASGLAGASGASASAAAPGPLDPDVRADIEQALKAARENTYENVTFSMNLRTMAIGRDQGRVSQQVVQTTMKGELSRAKDNNAMHFAYDMRSSTQPTVIAYDMYINKDGTLVKQDGKIYVAGDDAADPKQYIDSVTGVASEEEVKQLLDAASEYKIERGDDTVITVTAKASKLADSAFVDTQSLPEGSTMATLVVSYTISADNHFKAIRMMSSTSGTPTYRVNQSYEFSKYDKTEMPEWPSLADQVAADPRVKTDDQGRMYIIGDDGNTYLIESIDPDGTVHFYAEQQPQGGGGGYYAEPTGGGTSGGGGGNGGGGGGGTSGGGGGGNTGGQSLEYDGGGSTADESPQIADDSGSDIGEPVIYDDGSDE